MADNIKFGVGVEVPDKSAQNVGNLKKQLRDATQEAYRLSQTDYGSAAAIEAQKKVAKLKDQIDDAKDAVASFTDAGKFQAITKAAAGIAGGFAAAQGAAALFGNESEDLQKVLLKVNAAMAFGQGLTALEDLPRAFKQIGIIIKSEVIPSLFTLRGALIATGVGAAAVAVGLLAANWESVVGWVREFIGIGPSQADIVKDQTKAIEEQNKAISQGQFVRDLYIRQLAGRNKTEAEMSKAHTDELLALYQSYQDKLLKINEDESIKDAERKKQKEEAQAQYLKNLSLLNETQAKEQRELKKKLDAEEVNPHDQKVRLINTMNANHSLNQAVIDGIRDRIKKSTQLERIGAEELKKINKELYDDYLKRVEARKEFESEAAQSTIGNVISVTGALTESFEAQKGLAIADTLLQTYSATQTAFAQANKNPTSILAPIYPYLVAATTLAAGLARVAKMKQIKPSSTSGGATSTPAPPTTFTPAQATSTGVGGNVTAPTTQRPARVYVLQQDIRDEMNKVDVLDKNARIM